MQSLWYICMTCIMLTYRQGLNSNVFRFVAKLDTKRPIDIDRTFIIFYYLSDNTIAVFERPQRNSGV